MSWFGIGEAITTAGNLAIAQENNRTNREINRETNENNYRMNQENNAANQAIAQANNDMQYKIANEANAFNRETQQMTNEFNAAEAEKARQFQLDMWNETFDKTNAYNDPSAQVERLRAAGLNPALMMSGSGVGNVSSGGSTGSGTAASAGSNIGAVTPQLSTSYNQAGHNEPYYEKAPYLTLMGDIASDVNTMYGIYNQNRITNATLEQMKHQNDYIAGMTNWANTTDYAKDFLTSTNYVSWELANKMNTADASLTNLRYQNQVADAQAISLNLQNSMQTTKNSMLQEYYDKYFNPAQKLDLSLRLAGIYQQLSAGELNQAEAKESAKRAALVQAQTNGINISNKIADALADASIDAMKEQQEYTKNYYSKIKDDVDFQIRLQRAQGISNAIGSILGGVGSAAGAIFLPMKMSKAANGIGKIANSPLIMGIDW